MGRGGGKVGAAEAWQCGWRGRAVCVCVCACTRVPSLSGEEFLGIVGGLFSAEDNGLERGVRIELGSHGRGRPRKCRELAGRVALRCG